MSPSPAHNNNITSTTSPSHNNNIITIHRHSHDYSFRSTQMAEGGWGNTEKETKQVLGKEISTASCPVGHKAREIGTQAIQEGHRMHGDRCRSPHDRQRCCVQTRRDHHRQGPLGGLALSITLVRMSGVVGDQVSLQVQTDKELNEGCSERGEDMFSQTET